jgi:hypothetical protein
MKVATTYPSINGSFKYLQPADCGTRKTESSDMLMIILIFQGELFEILEDDKCLPEEQVQAIAKQLVFFS